MIDALQALELGSGVAIGFVVGLLGGGGAILTWPLLVVGFDVGEQAATVTSLAVVAVASLLGVVVHGRAGAVRWREGAVIGVVGVPATFAGSWTSQAVPDLVLAVAFVGMLVASGVAMVRPRGPREQDAPTAGRGLRATVLAALGIGLLTGFLGVGAGWVVVPVLVLVLGLPVRLAVGTSLLVLLINAGGGLLYRAIDPPPDVDLSLTVFVVAGAAVGSVLGALLSSRVPGAALRTAFGVLVLAVAVVTAIQTVTTA